MHLDTTQLIVMAGVTCAVPSASGWTVLILRWGQRTLHRRQCSDATGIPANGCLRLPRRVKVLQFESGRGIAKVWEL